MRLTSRLSFPHWGLAAALGLILVVLAALQYHWSGRVSESERERMQATLRTAMNQFREDLHHELAAVGAAFELDQAGVPTGVEEAYAERYQEWRRRTPYPDLVANVYLWESGMPHPGLSRLTPNTGQFEAAACPARFGALCKELRLKPSEHSGVLGAAPPPFVWTLEGGIPALVHPLVQDRQTRGQGRELDISGYLVVELNRVCLQTQVFAELAQRYFGSADGLLYQVAVLSAGNQTAPIYVSDPVPPNQILTGRDAVIQLFGPRHEERLNRRDAREPGARWGPDIGLSQRFSLFPQNDEFAPRFRAPVIMQRPGDGRWQLVVKHRSGSVEDAVAAGRRKNLAVSFGILLVLVVGMGMLVVSTGRAQRLAGLQVEFVAGVSHELRTPLAVISSAADNLAAGVVEANEHVRQYGTLIGTEVHRLSGMVEQILLFASGEARQRPYEIRPVDVGEIVDRVLSGADGMIDEADFTVDKQIQPGLPPALADAGALTQCLQNLISNALKYGRDRRWLGIRGRLVETGRGPEIEVRVEDKGMGIDREDLPHIFEPFYRGRAVKSAQIRGTGLGLSLAKRITESMGGRLSVASVPGRGSSFTLHFPASVSGSAALDETA
jgi:two-component system, OmpR family, sensor histidine kinase SenX3